MIDQPIPYTVTDLDAPIPYRVRVDTPSAALRSFVAPRHTVPVFSVPPVPAEPASEPRLVA